MQGSWSIGLFVGATPFELRPFGAGAAAQQGAGPANPIITCASVKDVPSNFVADPFLYFQPNGSMYVFYETKSNPTMQGDIAVSASRDAGASWHYLGIALHEPWHLSYPFVFEWEGAVYMLPEGAVSGSLYLYRVTDFPTGWERDRVLLQAPLVDASLAQWGGRWWMFASNLGAVDGGELEVYHATSPLGPWEPHALNPVMNGDPSVGARSAGRPVVHGGRLYRFGQDCGQTYGHKVVAYRVDVLSPSEFQQTRVPFDFGGVTQPGLLPWGRDPGQAGGHHWNSKRQHHVDAHQHPDGSWVAVMDGDYQM